MVTEVSHYLSAGVRVHRSPAALLVAFAILLAFTGCGDSHVDRVPVFPVRGAIRFQEQTPTGAFIVLHRKDGSTSNAPKPRAVVASDGTFAIGSYDGQDGAPEGEYVLTVQWNKLVKNGNDTVSGPNVLPAKYASPKTSDIKVTVASNENQLKPIQLR